MATKKKTQELSVKRKRRKPAGHKAVGKRVHEWERVLWRYVAVSSVLGVLALIYNLHPYYARTSPNFRDVWQPFFNSAARLWLVAGIPYVYVTRRGFGGTRMDLTDGAVHYLLFFRGIFYWVFEGCAWPRHIWRNRRMRITILSLGVKSFFTPLMACFMTEHWNNIWGMWFRHKGVTPLTPDAIKELNATGPLAWWNYMLDVVPKLLPTWQGFADGISRKWMLPDWRWGLDFYYQLLFFVDCIWALTGYAAESRWLGNKTKSVEPTGFGWMVALMCYPPFNDISGTLFPLNMDQSHSFHFSPETMLLLKGMTCASFTIYVWATLAFGPTFSNLTNRGIITRGPYAVIRHPAYTCKNFAWWLEYIPYMNHFHNLLPIIIWNIIYGLRAWTEERHLSRDPDYVAYKKKVKWVAIPGVF